MSDTSRFCPSVLSSDCTFTVGTIAFSLLDSVVALDATSEAAASSSVSAVVPLERALMLSPEI